MPAVSKAQQRFFGMVRAAQKGEMGSPSAEVSKAATSMSKSDVKKFAKTKHKGLPNKVKVKEESDFPKDAPSIKDAKPRKKTNVKYYKNLGYAPVKEEKKNGRCPAGQYYCYTDEKCKPIPKGFRVVGPAGMLRKENGHTEDETNKKNGKKNGNVSNGNGNGNGSNGSGSGTGGSNGSVSETTYYKSDTKYQKKLSDDDGNHKEQDKRMKFGKFYDKAKEAKDRLRPGEVKRYDKKLGKWVSNKD